MLPIASDNRHLDCCRQPCRNYWSREARHLALASARARSRRLSSSSSDRRSPPPRAKWRRRSCDGAPFKRLATPADFDRQQGGASCSSASARRVAACRRHKHARCRRRRRQPEAAYATSSARCGGGGGLSCVSSRRRAQLATRVVGDRRGASAPHHRSEFSAAVHKNFLARSRPLLKLNKHASADRARARRRAQAEGRAIRRDARG